MTRIMFHLAALGAAIVCPIASRADYIWEDGSLPPTQTPASATIAVKGFDPALGTLISVDIWGYGDGWITVDFFNATPFPVTEFGFGYARVEVGTPSGSLVIDGSVVEFPGLGVLDLAPGASTTRTTGGNDSLSGGTVPLNELSEFVSSGDVLLPARLRPGELGLQGPLIATVDSTSLSVSISVVYTYDPVPEPSSIILLVSVLAAAGWLQCTGRRDSLRP